MIGLLKGFGMREMFLNGMPGLSRAFYCFLCLFKSYMPKLHAHLIEQAFIPHIYATDWFMTIFSCSLPFEGVLRIWDIYLVEGPKTMYRIALAIFKINQ